MPHWGLSHFLDGGRDAQLFRIDAARGRLEFASQPTRADSDAGRSHEVAMRVIDPSGAASRQMLTITLDSAPADTRTRGSRGHNRIDGDMHAETISGFDGHDRLMGMAETMSCPAAQAMMCCSATGAAKAPRAASIPSATTTFTAGTAMTG